jgi:hypothetical protein
MLVSAFGSALAIILASLVLGRAICTACGGPGRWWAAPAVGFAALMILAGAAIKLPGKATSSEVVCAAALAAAAAYLAWSAWRRRARPRLPLGDLVVGGVGDLVVGGAALAGASIPFVASGRVGPGVGIDNDMAVHLIVAEALRSASYERIWNVLSSGYPTGPHSVVATLGTASGEQLISAFAGLMIAVVVLTALTAANVLAGHALWRRVVVGVMSSLTYLVASYYGEGAFKETIMAALLLAFVLHLEQVRKLWATASPFLRWRLLIPAGLLVAGALYAYSYAGVAWFAATLGVWTVVEVALRPALIRGWISRRRLLQAAPWAAAGVVLGFLILLPIAGSVAHFFSSFSVSSTNGIPKNDLGNLITALPPHQALGVWWSGDFRKLPNNLFLAGELSAVALAVFLFGVVWSLRRRELLLPAAAAGAFLIWLYSERTQSPYVAAKALVIGAPLVMAIALRALLTRGERRPSTRALALVAGAALVVPAAYSTFDELRNAPVQAPEAGRELVAFHRTTGNAGVLFLGIDDWAVWDLHNSPVATLSAGSDSIGGVATRPNKGFGEQELDFDSVVPADLDKFRWVITTNTKFASQAPANFRLVAQKRLYQLWERTGPTVPFSILDGVGQPGAILDCHTRFGRRLRSARGQATLMPTPIAVPGVDLAPGQSGVVGLPLPRGRWKISLQYLSTVPLKVAAQRGHWTMPAFMGRVGGIFGVGEVTGGGARLPVILSLYAQHPSRLSGSLKYTDILSVEATRVPDTRRMVPLREACGKYVDWYRLT